jgi:hypothetical protein
MRTRQISDSATESLSCCERARALAAQRKQRSGGEATGGSRRQLVAGGSACTSGQSAGEREWRGRRRQRQRQRPRQRQRQRAPRTTTPARGRSVGRSVGASVGARVQIAPPMAPPAQPPASPLCAALCAHTPPPDAAVAVCRLAGLYFVKSHVSCVIVIASLLILKANQLKHETHQVAHPAPPSCKHNSRWHSDI